MSDDLFLSFTQNHTFPPISENLSFPHTYLNFPLFSFNLRVFALIHMFLLPLPILTMMHLYIKQYSYWATLGCSTVGRVVRPHRDAEGGRQNVKKFSAPPTSSP